MKNSTKIFTFLLVVCMLVPLALTACGNAGQGTTTTTTGDSTPATTTTTTSTTTAPSGDQDGPSEDTQTSYESALQWAFGTPKDGTLSSATTTVESWSYNTIEIDSVPYYGYHAYENFCFTLDGIQNPNNNGGQYYRLDYSNATNYPGSFDTSTHIGSGVAYLASQTAGVTLRFCTDATKIALIAEMQNCYTTFTHFPKKGIYGFDVYVGTGTNRIWVTTTQDQAIMKLSDYNTSSKEGSMKQVISLPAGYKEVMICFPQYGGVKSLQIGFPSKTNRLAKPTERTGGTIAFYGTSITQGACSSRAGTSYTNILGRVLDAEVRNFGFSGSAAGEQSVAQYIASISNLNAFIMDYDRNHVADATGQAELAAAHYPFYQTVRAAHPDIPIIFLTRPIFTVSPTTGDLAMRNTVKESYDKAVAAGDTNVYFIDGTQYFTDGMEDVYTVDGTHPNDTGHFFMASKVYPVLGAALSK